MAAAPLALLALGATLFILGYVPREREAELRTWRSALSLRADHLGAVIDQWVADGLGDAALVASYPTVQSFLTARSDRDAAPPPSGTTHLATVLGGFLRLQGYSQAFVVGRDGQILAAAPPSAGLGDGSLAWARTVLSSGAPAADFHPRGADSPVIAFAAPVALVTEGDPNGAPVGVVVLETNPSSWLYPRLLEPPLAATSAESVLTRRDGKQLLYISPLRHEPEAPLPLSRSWDAPSLAARRAPDGRTEPVGLETDYRGVPVLAESRPVPGTPWRLVVKADRDDVLAAFRRRMWITGLSGGTILVTLAAMAAGLWAAVRRAQEARLALSQARLAALLEGANDAILFVGRDGRIHDVNQRAVEMYGMPRSALVGRELLDLASGESRESASAEIRAALGEERRIFQTVQRDSTGSPLPVEISTRVVTSGKEPLLVAIVRDVTERQVIEEGLRKLSLAVEQSPVAVVITDTKGTIEYVNPRFTETTGYKREEVLGQNPSVLKSGEMPREGYRDLWETISSGRTWRGQFHNRRKDGELFWEDASISPIRNRQGVITHYVAVKEDITERKRAESALAETQEQLLQSRKMEAVGRLAGGVAHDFNNILGVIQGYAELALRGTTDEDPRMPKLKGILQASSRAAELVHQLLAFGRKQVLEPRVVSLPEVLKGSRNLLDRLIGEDVQLKVVVDEDAGRVKVDPSQIQQVVLNLVINARDAMPRGGNLTLEVRNVDLDTTYADTHRSVVPGRYVMLAVSDTGVGMSPEVAAHVFEPFFTTKESGKGTGLGLATVYGIVKQSGGYVWVYTEPGVGTSFKVYLPRVEAQEGAVTAEVPAAVARGRGETILLVEDEPAVRELLRDMLEGNGYVVISARNGGEALAAAATRVGRIDLLLADVIMPGMSGREVAARLQEWQPDLRVLYMSGYTDDIVARHGVLEPGLRLLQKPFGEAALTRAVREALDRPKG